MVKHLLSALTLVLFSLSMQAQSTEELTAKKAEKEAELAPLEAQLADLKGKVDALKAEVADLTEKVTPYPRWDVGALGNIGLNFANFKNWYSKSTPSTQALSLGISANGYANLDQKRYFWRNNTNLTLGWLKFKDTSVKDVADTLQVTADAFNIVSLFGFKLTEKLAASTLGEYRTSVLDGKFNNPGYLDLGAGATWTPLTDLVVVFHPLNYNFVFSDSDFDYESSLGCKVVADYKRQITKGLAWKSNFSGFFSYKNSDLHNWTFINGVTTAVRGLGIGLDLGLRSNKQEALAADPLRTDNPLQLYYLIGLSYAISSKK